ncbi:MAG TPA: N-acetyltransferase [Rhizobiaceae bacterium]|nr:N-acetyltransferase [Rhizobiaceae bacterium]
MKLRRAIESDVDRLVEVEHACFDPRLYTAMSPRQFRYHVTSPNSVLIVGVDSNRSPLGYALGFLHGQRKSIRFYSLAVAPDAQRGDIGKLLFEAIEQEARRRGLGVQCEVREDNEKLKARYSKIGYHPYRRVENYYPDGAACLKYLKNPLSI